MKNAKHTTDAFRYLAIHEGFLQEHFSELSAPQAFKPLSVEEVFDTISQSHAVLNIAFNPESQTYYLKSAPNVAFIPIVGPTSKYGGWSSVGYLQLSAMLDRVKKDERYKGVFLYIDSPGGTVDGTSEWAAEIRNAGMPTLAFIDGMGASAGFWQAISADKVLANNNNENFIGSIGVQTIHVDASEVLEKNVGKVTLIRARQSSMKNRPNSFEPLSEEDRKKIEDRVSSMAGKFISYVQERRPGISTDGNALKGEVYTGEEAVQMGMIDGLDSLQGAIGQLTAMFPEDEEEESNNQSQNLTSNTTMKFKAALTAILTALGFANVASDEESPLVTEERLEALNASLETANARVTELEGNVSTLTTERDTASQDLATMTTDRDQWKEKAEKYGKNAGANHSPPPKEKAEGGNGEAEGDSKEFLSYSHNVEALNEIKNFS